MIDKKEALRTGFIKGVTMVMEGMESEDIFDEYEKMSGLNELNVDEYILDNHFDMVADLEVHDLIEDANNLNKEIED